ncbi:sorting and assembly machinery component 50 homolog [Branchiostoma floridae x Branchiostoma japonicum]
MGTVHAKAPEAAGGVPEMEGHERHEIVLDSKPVKVERVHVDGLGRTKDDIIVREVKDVLNSTSFEDVILRSHHAKMRLERLGIFKNVGIFIDTSKGPEADPNGLEVTFEVKELRPLTGTANTMVGNNEGSMVFGVRMPNIFGRAEKVVSEYSYSNKQRSSFAVTFMKPLHGNPDYRLNISGWKTVGHFPWSSYREVDRGVASEITFPLLGQQTLRWEGVWRELGCLTRMASFAVREQAGHSLKSSLKHTYVVDSRDDPILPTKGAMFKLNQELAGIAGGDVKFLKEDVELQVNKELVWDTIVSCSLRGGIMKPLKGTSSRINDRFFLGGPTTLRGFDMHGIGPKSEGDFMGSEGFWAAGLHLYTPLPFRPGKGGFGELFRTHMFVTAGNLFQPNLEDMYNYRDHWARMASDVRWSYGVGVLFRLGRIARLELNYCIPGGARTGDKVSESVQLGVGVTFL